MTRSTWSVIATAIAMLLSAASILPAAAAPAADPLAGAPATGECRNYSMKGYQAAHETSPAVDCAGPHTALVVGVAIAPNRFDLSGKPSAGLVRFAMKACEDAWANATGTTHQQDHLVVYTRSWFTPTKSQLAAGARWVRCDVNAFDNGKLGDLPATTPFVDGGIDRGERRCLTGRRNIVVPCTSGHRYISRGIARVPDGRFSVARQDAVAKRRCGSTLKRSDRRYLWTRISESSWKAGERHVTCYGNGR